MPDRPLLDRAQLARIAQNVPQTIAGLEKLIGNVAGIPSTIEEANALAGSALAVAQVAMASFSVLAEALAQLEGAPRVHLGTISNQNHDSVEITGGTAGLNAGAVDAPSLYLGGDKTTGIYRSGPDTIGIAIAGAKLLNLMAQMLEVTGKITITDQITSTLATGTAPLIVASTTKVANLYVDRAALADNATTANSLSNPTALPTAATDLPTVIALANALRSAAQSKGL